MPVAQNGPPSARQALVIGIGALCGLVAVVFLVTRLDRLGGDDATVEAGDPTFAVGDARQFAEVIADEGPLFLPDAARGDRDLYLQHLGDDPTSGWLAFSVRPPGADRGCFVEWRAADQRFVDSCDGTTYPPTGDGLPRYGVSVDADGALSIHLDQLDDDTGDGAGG